MKTLRTLILSLLALAASASASAADFYARGVAHCILDDGSGTFPVSEVGEVFVSTTADATPQWTAGTFTSETISGAYSTAKGGSANFCFWARAKAGYTFVGWTSTKTSKNPTSGTETLEGQPWTSKTTFWSPKTEEAPNELVRYAIFRKNASEDLTPGGVAMTTVEGVSHIMGSSSSDWGVQVNFAEPLAYKNYEGYSTGYGVNTSLLGFITCREKTSGAEVRVTSARIVGTYAAEGADAHGVIYFPASMPVGTYDVHLPKGLFTTQSGEVTAAVDFVVTVTADTTPLTIVEMRPKEGGTWNADPEDRVHDYDGESLMLTFTFNRNLQTLNLEGKDFILTNAANGRQHTAANVFINQLNTRQGLVSFGSLPSGNYSFTLPAGVFSDVSGIANESATITFKIVGSSVDEWALPIYNVSLVTPAANATVKGLGEIRVAFAREGFAAPVALNEGIGVSAVRVWETYEEGVDYTDPDNRPTEESAPISGVSASIEGGELVITISPLVNEDTKVVVTIPAGLVTNVEDAASLSPEALCKAGGCTNDQLQILYRVEYDPLSGMTAAPVATSTPVTSATQIFTLDGRPATTQSGLRIIRTTAAGGEMTTRKVMVK